KRTSAQPSALCAAKRTSAQPSALCAAKRTSAQPSVLCAAKRTSAQPSALCAPKKERWPDGENHSRRLESASDGHERGVSFVGGKARPVSQATGTARSQVPADDRG